MEALETLFILPRFYL